MWTLAHRSTGRRVTLVGVMHIGDSSYFDVLSDLLFELARHGEEIHVEGISAGTAHGTDDLDLTPWERERLAEAATWADPEAATAGMLQLASQRVGLRLPDNTRNVDLSDLDLLRAVGWRDYERLLRPAPISPPLRRPTGLAVRSAMRFQLRYGRAIQRIRALRPRNRRIDRVVIGSRNRWAFMGAHAALQWTDVVLVWGTDHLPGLAAMFRANGYRLHHEAWLEACRI